MIDREGGAAFRGKRPAAPGGLPVFHKIELSADACQVRVGREASYRPDELHYREE